MKVPPRIHSLSTLGLIHHQEFDYFFHPLRTDFIGESGSGKSMIADLLQLILVGSEAFESATKGIGARTPEGMVLDISGRATNNIGYAFLNIEKGPDQFVVIGSYIETASRHTQMFIIQGGYDFDNISPLTTPLLFKDFLKDEDILPIDLLKEFLEPKGAICETWQRSKPFHEILAKNEILPIDLSTSDKILKDYARILQAFSRGKSFDTQKSTSLKDFLFGKEKGQEILKKFNQAVHELQAVIGDYGRNLQEIERVTQKQKALIILKEKKKDLEEKQLLWLTSSFSYWCQKEASCQDAIRQISKQFLNTNRNLKQLEEVLAKRTTRLQTEKATLEENEKTTTDRFEIASLEYRKVKELEKILSLLKCDFKEIRSKYQTNKELIELKSSLDTAVTVMRNAGILSFFETLNLEGRYEQFKASLASECSELANTLKEKDALKAYSDLNNKDSLGYWALQQKRAFSREDESAIVHFQKLKRKKERNVPRYLPDPNELFSNLNIVEREPEGFWLSLNGVREYIFLVNTQILNTSDENKIRSYFKSFSETLSDEIEAIRSKLASTQKVLDVFEKLDNPRSLFAAFSKRAILKENSIIPALNISVEQFNSLVSSYEGKQLIEEEYLNAKSKSDLAKQKISNHSKEVDLLRRLADSITKNSSKDYNADAMKIITSFNEEIDNHNEEFQTKMNEFLEDPLLHAVSFSGYLERMGGNLNVNDLVLERSEQHKTANQNKTTFYNLYTDAYNSEPMITETILTEPTREKEKYKLAEQSYIEEFKRIVDTYLIEDSYKFQASPDFLELGRNLLPEAFQSETITETTIISVVEKYLLNINEKNRQLNNRKIQRIKDLMEEVNDVITNQLEIVRRIDNFFKSDDKKITGGHKVRLRKSWSNDFKKEWIDHFNNRIDSEISSSPLQSDLANHLSIYVGLEEMMKEAFYTCGGVRTNTLSIAKLLDPCSYYDLSFSMESAAGKANMGSTGQTYSAIALLCIARLSIIGMEEGEKPNPGIRIMPVDEAEGLGSNYDMLYQIAKDFDYQILSLSVNPVGKFQDGSQYVYMLHKNLEELAPVNYTPMAIFCKADINKNDKK